MWLCVDSRMRLNSSGSHGMVASRVTAGLRLLAAGKVACSAAVLLALCAVNGGLLVPVQQCRVYRSQ